MSLSACEHVCQFIPGQENQLKRTDIHTFLICFVLDSPQEERRDSPYLLLRRQPLAVTIAEFKTVNKEVMGFEPTVISSLALAITQDISR